MDQLVAVALGLLRICLMPSGKVGSYPVVLQAFTDPSLQDLPLVVFGPEAQRCAEMFVSVGLHCKRGCSCIIHRSGLAWPISRL